MSNPPDHLNPTILALQRQVSEMERTIEQLREECVEWRQCADALATDMGSLVGGQVGQFKSVNMFDRLSKK